MSDCSRPLSRSRVESPRLLPFSPLCVLLLCTTLAGACQPSAPPPSATQAQGAGGAGASGNASATTKAARPGPVLPPLTPFPRTLTDALGNTLTIPAPPRRIVSQTLGTDEILFAICPHDRIVGVSTLARDEAYSNVLKEARASGAPPSTDAEQVLRLKPDLIFVASYSRAEVVDLVRASGAPIFRFANFDRIEDMKTNIRIVGRATGEDAAADALVADMDRRLAVLADRVKGPRPRVMSYSNDGFTAGANTLFNDVIRAAGGDNVPAANGIDGFARVSGERVLQWNPDVIVAGARPGQDQVVRESLLRNPTVAATRAGREGRIITMPAREFEAASQHVVNAAETLSAALWTKPASAPAAAAPTR